MNKRILISLSIIGAVAAIAIGGTIAYFSDVETSTGNTFTAGTLDLTIDNHCYYNGAECAWYGNNNGYEPGYYWNGNPLEEECYCTWSLDDLNGKVFFNFTDLKPADWGEDTVSLHVTNDAWACVTITSTKNDDISSTEPELKAGDAQENPADLWDGELAQNLEFFFWADMCSAASDGGRPGDNKYTQDCGRDIPLMQGSATNILGGVTYTLADSDENNVGGADGQPLNSGATYYIGKVWCFGDLDKIYVPGEPVIWTCNGAPITNLSQTDSLTGDIEFYAVQSRNNADFTCRDESLVGHWRFNEGQGNTAYDSSGYGNHGTIYGATWASPALHFDGVDDYVNAGNNSSLALVDKLTIEAWVKFDGLKWVNSIVNKGDETLNKLYWLGHLPYYGDYIWFLEFGDNTARDTVKYYHTPNLGEWYHVAATFDNGLAKIYINGAKQAEKTSAVTSMDTNDYSAIIGGYLGSSHSFDGTIDEVRIYNRALSDSEILADYNAGR